jgi:hypothetical protein
MAPNLRTAKALGLTIPIAPLARADRITHAGPLNREAPSWAGVPFFYWYQLLWVIIGAMLTAIVNFATDD